MHSIRFTALNALQSREPLKSSADRTQYSEIFGINVFNQKAMRHYLSKDTYKKVVRANEHGEKITRETADVIAAGMKSWALERGASHYTHWFQPLTGATAEKHDSFFDMRDGEPIESFSGNSLVQQEPDASSFPSGGIRNTFEARGYTAWDPSSPAFLMSTQAGMTLCIPTIFISYTGEALDFKAPLLKTLHNLEATSLEICQWFDKDVKHAKATLGIEQEYFLVDLALANARPDLLVSGRTLLGHAPAKGQQLEDHYFGSIPERVNAFMVDFEKECYMLGIPLRTRHNEVAPAQYECAPLFEEVNIAVDHNQLLMDIMEKVARRHSFKAILHEKPFSGINGSGKHCNWSIGTDTGVNLLSPGDSPKNNIQFLSFFINVIKAVHDHADLLRASIASAANDHRLGANEAPPAIISVFIGNHLTKILDEIERSVPEKYSEKFLAKLRPEIPKVPEIELDNTDRNRTSPFAFTGNKFEFRAVGSSSNTSSAMTVLNTIVANQLREFADKVNKKTHKNSNRNLKILTVLQEYIPSCKKILFEGNNYSEEWVKEAKKRGLSNIKTTPEALDADVSKKTIQLYTSNGIFNHRELEARHEIRLEMYTKQIQIESRILAEIALTHVVPAAIEYQNKLLTNLNLLKEAGLKTQADACKETIQNISSHISNIRTNVTSMTEERRLANNITDSKKMALAYCHKVKPYFDIIRLHSDKVEACIDDAIWPLPKYREMLFLK